MTALNHIFGFTPVEKGALRSVSEIKDIPIQRIPLQKVPMIISRVKNRIKILPVSLRISGPNIDNKTTLYQT